MRALSCAVLAWTPAIWLYYIRAFDSLLALPVFGWGCLLAAIGSFLCFKRPRTDYHSVRAAHHSHISPLWTVACVLNYGYLPAAYYFNYLAVSTHGPGP